MSESKPIIYVSKRCDYCIELLKILTKRSDIRGNFSIFSIDDNPYPNFIKAVPCMVSDGELYSSKEIFSMLEESDSSQQSGQCSTGGNGGEAKECSIDGYCKGDTCLGFSSIDGDSGPSLDTYFSTIDQEATPQNNPSSNDDYRNQKKSSFDSEYEKMMNERGALMGNNQQQQQINFSR